MLENLLSAYLEERNKEVSILKNIKKLDRVNKMFLIVIIISLIITFIFLLLKKWLYSLIPYVIYLICIYFFDKLLTRKKYKNWRENTKQYARNLNILREILKRKEYQLYEKNKIKQLIRKYKYDIQEEENEKNRQFFKRISVLLIPIGGYVVGKLDSIVSSEVLILGAVILCISLILGWCVKEIFSVFIDLLMGGRTEEKKQLIKKLQDILDQDFPIKEEDLI